MEKMYDVVIVGGGPAGLTAAIYLARAKYRVLVLEKERFGGQIAITDEVVNYPGIASISGSALTDTMKKQAEDFGAEFLIAEATEFDFSEDIKFVNTNKGTFQCFGILLATGAHPRNVGFRGEETFKGHGVAYCATCDGEFFTGKDLFVVGGGFAAAEESIFLTKYARHVTVLVRKDDFSCAASVAEKTKKHEKITVLTNTVLEEVSGDEGLRYARYKNTLTGKVTEYKSAEGETFGVFVFAGYEPASECFRGKIALDEKGYIVTDASQKTSADGVYAAGDVCVKPLRQVVTATGDGALAATQLEKHVCKMQQKTGIHPVVPAKAKKESKELGSFSGDMKQQLESLFAKMEQKLILMLHPDDSKLSSELEIFLQELTTLSDKLSLKIATDGKTYPHTPFVRMIRDGGKDLAIAFHGVPGGHEFTSFVLGLYNAAGPGQPTDVDVKEKIDAICDTVGIKILVTLSCSMCPDTVIAAQKIASLNSNVHVDVYDIRHFPDLQKKYNVMSVPCVVINDEKVAFGKKNIAQILDMIP